jgi:hypothetical protein
MWKCLREEKGVVVERKPNNGTKSKVNEKNINIKVKK